MNLCYGCFSKFVIQSMKLNSVSIGRLVYSEIKKIWSGFEFKNWTLGNIIHQFFLDIFLIKHTFEVSVPVSNFLLIVNWIRGSFEVTRFFCTLFAAFIKTGSRFSAMTMMTRGLLQSFSISRTPLNQIATVWNTFFNQRWLIPIRTFKDRSTICRTFFFCNKFESFCFKRI